MFEVPTCTKLPRREPRRSDARPALSGVVGATPAAPIVCERERPRPSSAATALPSTPPLVTGGRPRRAAHECDAADLEEAARQPPVETAAFVASQCWPSQWQR